MAALGTWRPQSQETAPFQCSPTEPSLVVQAGKIKILDFSQSHNQTTYNNRTKQGIFYQCAAVNMASFKRWGGGGGRHTAGASTGDNAFPIQQNPNSGFFQQTWTRLFKVFSDQCAVVNTAIFKPWGGCSRHVAAAASTRDSTFPMQPRRSKSRLAFAVLWWTSMPPVFQTNMNQTIQGVYLTVCCSDHGKF